MPKRTGKLFTVKLTDDDVIAIVEGINQYEGRSRTDCRDGAVTVPVMKPILSRYFDIMITRRAEYRTEYLAAILRAARVDPTTDEYYSAKRAMRTACSSIATLLGHAHVMQGTAHVHRSQRHHSRRGLPRSAYECTQCGATGAAGDDLYGTIFHTRCGELPTLADAVKPGKMPAQVYECGRDDCPGTTETAHRGDACPGTRERGQ